MDPDLDFDPKARLPAHAVDLVGDLELERLLETMAAGEEFLLDVARAALLTSLEEPHRVRYRQAVLGDWLDHPAALRELYAIARDGVVGERKIYGSYLSRYPDSLLSRSVAVLNLLMGLARQLRDVAESQLNGVGSEGVQRFRAMLASELDDAYLAAVDEHLQRLRSGKGELVSARLGLGNHGIDYVLRLSPNRRPGWKDLLPGGRSGYVYQIAQRDDAGTRALRDLRNQGLAAVAAAVAQAADHVIAFFRTLRTELGFYVGCLNLHEELAAKGEPTCFPEPEPVGAGVLSGHGLYDASLSLRLDGRAVGNDVLADGRPFLFITGANKGGKSTFLRSIGQAQLMMQAGMFVPAQDYRASLCHGLFSHFKREEDAAMESGKLDEELRRMSGIVDAARPGGLVLLNESFASTNEREGSEIAVQIVRALVQSGVRVVFVTHLFDLAERIYREDAERALFLRAERLSDGMRTFRLIPGEPLPTSFGRDLYRRIFGLESPSVPEAPLNARRR
jgi:hypothetical protein